MASLSLAARYRPQSFSEVGGQELATTALSRAAAADSPAPAYLFSGTRGVGKTTMARIFAKALNCERGPAPEPCNECAQCRKITEGKHVDVCEIDGASNNRVEDARALRETIGYAPMEGRYKVFIIDEAHMLSNSAFNALLKTLEEPPPRVVFIFATTESHKFPITIVSRCQHFVFGHLSEEALVRHLGDILHKENRTYEAEAVRIIAKRAAGSARDGMSLLDQVLALEEGGITAEKTRRVLGLAGIEIFEQLFSALATADLEQIIKTTRQILQKGLDLGYFTREFSTFLRNLFLLKEGGEKLSSVLELSGNQKNFLLRYADAFSSAHLHAAWQLAIGSQREIAQNSEPGIALELMLVNMALLPRLLPTEDCSSAKPEHKLNERPHDYSKNARPGPSANGAPTLDDQESGSGETRPAPPVVDDHKPEGMIKNWQGFREFCSRQREEGLPAPGNSLLSSIEADISEEGIIFTFSSQSAFENAQKQESLLRAVAQAYFDTKNIELRGLGAPKSETEIKEELASRPELQPCIDILNARITRCREIKKGVRNEKYE